MAGDVGIKNMPEKQKRRKTYCAAVGYGISCNIELYAVVPILSADIIIQLVADKMNWKTAIIADNFTFRRLCTESGRLKP